MNTKLNYDNSTKFIILFLLSIFKTIIFVIYLILNSISGVGNKPITLSDPQTPIERLNATMLAVFVFLLFSSLGLRIFFARNLRNDEVFRQTGLDVKQYSIGFKFIPLITSILLITKSFRDKISIGNDWTTRQLILKWKIINFIKDLVVLLWLSSIVLAIVSLILRFGLGNTMFEGFNEVVLIIIFVGIFYFLIPFYFLASYSLKIYRLINKRERTYWKSASYVFFMPFFYFNAWKNILRLSKKLRIAENTLASQNGTETQVINNKISRQFYQFTIVKNIFYLNFVIVFTATISLAITKSEIFRNPGVALIFFHLFNISTMTYLIYIGPRYLADSVNMNSKRTSLILYILDIFVPTVSIYNLIKYKQNKTILV
ncbi:hypothetical protein R7U59_02000 [Mesomycoplasma ovipneumoniae]|uniref:Uncharacterized protein n=1 Tax=Mesomycoplasma ovipneumoniae TaxID=29562 RepID=A0AAJ2P676_9BACT|nr:hypothetical protein [Mesomycoplasma ovipneumoniae]MDW2835626.1 hypothetical protein [Mesomycoplasma ovipneumoniae]MDW2862018.1 hypothetical protein [Mesomycoplasma ovipneumoniae]MDW2892046.1 hypothetical protein [Mesomycoplasma ovipneumoniae]MDW2892615.1 hypothetical protein [Mesomycoplasma ovipneumoniae]MDW2898256.1 hypothetical protein [Mesomycoplasma ovipneumoniae]